MLIQLRNYPGIRIGLGRKELTKLKQTTVFTLLTEAHQLLGVTESEYQYYDQKGLIKYLNGSSIQLAELVPAPSDPDYDRFGSLNFTHTVIEEAGEIVKKAKDMFHSRRNRYKNSQYGIVGRAITTCNPSQNFLKLEYYKPYKARGGGQYQIWPDGMVEVDGEKKTAYKAFIRSLATDNPFLPQNYIEVLKKLPPAERKRLLEGNWDYADTDYMLFKSSLIDRNITNRIAGGDRWMGVDISDVGKDKTILSLIEGDTLIDQREVSVDTNQPVGEQIALEVIKYAQQNGIAIEEAYRIAIDAIGVGASTRDFLRSKGWHVREFIAGASSADIMYKNLRGEAVYSLAQAMDRGEMKIYDQISTLETLREDLMAHEYETEERRILIKPKQEIKDVLGRSPDHAESFYIAFWAKNGNNDPSQDTSRIIF